MKEHMICIEPNKPIIGTKFKYFCLQFGNWREWSYFKFNLDWTRNCDHAGFTFGAEVFGFYIHFNIYDSRHWNYDNNRWNNQLDYFVDEVDRYLDNEDDGFIAKSKVWMEKNKDIIMGKVK